MAQISDVNPSVLSGSIEPAVKWHPIVGLQSCPIYYVHTHNYAQIIQPFQGPDLTEFRRYVSGYLKDIPKI